MEALRVGQLGRRCIDRRGFRLELCDVRRYVCDYHFSFDPFFTWPPAFFAAVVNFARAALCAGLSPPVMRVPVRLKLSVAVLFCIGAFLLNDSTIVDFDGAGFSSSTDSLNCSGVIIWLS